MILDFAKNYGQIKNIDAVFTILVLKNIQDFKNLEYL